MLNYYLSSASIPAQRAAVTVESNERRYALRVEHFSQAEITSSWTEPHRHTTYHFLLYCSDTRMEINGIMHPIRVNDAVLIGADVPHRFMTSENGRPSEYFEMTFDLIDGETPLVLPFPELLCILFPGYGTPPSSPVIALAPAQAEAIKAVLLKLPAHAAGTMKENFFGIAVSAGLIECLSILMASVRSGDSTERSSKVDAMIRFIYLNYHRRFSLDDAAEYCQANAQYLSRLFHREMKKTVMEYANEVRIAIAERMLTSREYRIREVARMTGFEDEYYFNKVFKQIKGFTPGSLLKDR